MGRFSVGMLLSLIVMAVIGVFMIKVLLKAIFFVLAILLLVGLVITLIKRL